MKKSRLKSPKEVKESIFYWYKYYYTKYQEGSIKYKDIQRNVFKETRRYKCRKDYLQLYDEVEKTSYNWMLDNPDKYLYQMYYSDLDKYNDKLYSINDPLLKKYLNDDREKKLESIYWKEEYNTWKKDLEIIKQNNWYYDKHLIHDSEYYIDNDKSIEYYNKCKEKSNNEKV